mmetsp:Transcript_44269/g.80201  ORF Transcript_44269/g.80201 Transcript_44269/m.80201 type:complete len:287 (-) Transcript_44269:29-889(-)
MVGEVSPRLAWLLGVFSAGSFPQGTTTLMKSLLRSASLLLDNSDSGLQGDKKTFRVTFQVTVKVSFLLRQRKLVTAVYLRRGPSILLRVGTAVLQQVCLRLPSGLSRLKQRPTISEFLWEFLQAPIEPILPLFLAMLALSAPARAAPPDTVVTHGARPAVPGELRAVQTARSTAVWSMTEAAVPPILLGLPSGPPCLCAADANWRTNLAAVNVEGLLDDVRAKPKAPACHVFPAAAQARADAKGTGPIGESLTWRDALLEEKLASNPVQGIQHVLPDFNLVAIFWH